MKTIMRFIVFRCRIQPRIFADIYCSNMAKPGMNPKTLQYLTISQKIFRVV